MTQRINIKLNEETGIGTLECVGLKEGTFPCGGKVGEKYPADSTIHPSDKKGTYHSKEYDVDMPYAILWIGQKGIYIHQWDNLEGSAGCIHLLPGHAQKVYDWIQNKTRILFTWVKPPPPPKE